MSQKRIKLGATGKHPRGHIHATDEGGLRFRLASDYAHGVVVVDFGTTVAWIGMQPALARELAAQLLKHAAQIEANGPLPSVPS